MSAEAVRAEAVSAETGSAGTLRPEEPPAVEVRALTKRFGARRVLSDLDLSFRPGRVTALIGPNGAGKTTLLKCVLGLVRPDSGQMTLGGHGLDDAGRYRRDIGFMPQLPHFPPHMTGRELATMLDELRGFIGEPDSDLVAALGLDRDLDRPFGTLSGGTRQKVNAALAFRFRTPLLVLDEPTAGLDPVSSLALKEKVRACRSEGRTVVVTSHNLGDLESLADDVVFLVEGRVRFQGPLRTLLAETGQPTLERAIASLMTEGDGSRTDESRTDGAKTEETDESGTSAEGSGPRHRARADTVEVA